jgi:hypothetical protein
MKILSEEKLARLVELVETLSIRYTYEIIENKEYDQQEKREKILEKNEIITEIYNILYEGNGK